jgi:DNA-binding response OmpR family regulator
MRYELIHLKTILSKSPAEIRAAYLLKNDPSGALTKALAERDELFERVQQLEGLFRGDEWIPDEWGLTGKEGQFLAALTHRSPATREFVHTALYGSDPNGGPNPQVLDVMLSKMRAKLTPHNIFIETHHGTGFRLSAETLKRCRAIRAEYSR